MTADHVQHGVLMLHPRCNMTCSFCVTDDSMATMTFDVARSLLDDLKARGFASAIFGGGEPLAWPFDLQKILIHAKELGLRTQIGTNAIRLPKDLPEWKFVDRWVIPMDGVTSDVHNDLRKYKNKHFEIITEALAKIKSAGFSATISTVVTKVNQNEIAGIGEYLRTLQTPKGNFLHAWHLYKFLPFGRGGELNQARLEVSDELYEEKVQEARNLDLPFHVFKRKDMLLSKTVEFFWVEDGRLMAQSRGAGKRLLQPITP